MYFLFKALFWEISKTDEKKLLKIFGNSVGLFNSLLLSRAFYSKDSFLFLLLSIYEFTYALPCFFSISDIRFLKIFVEMHFFYLDVRAWRLCSCKICIYLCHDHQIGKQREFFILIDFLNDNNKTLNAIFF